MKTKYRTLRGFDNKRDAEKCLQSIFERYGELAPFSIKERKWNDKDKRRYYVRQLIRKGVKK